MAILGIGIEFECVDEEIKALALYLSSHMTNAALFYYNMGFACSENTTIEELSKRFEVKTVKGYSGCTEGYIELTVLDKENKRMDAFFVDVSEFNMNFDEELSKLFDEIYSYEIESDEWWECLKKFGNQKIKVTKGNYSSNFVFNDSINFVVKRAIPDRQ